MFDAKPVQYSIIKTEQVSLQPLASIEGSTVMNFLDVGLGEDYKNLESIYLVLRVKMNTLGDDGAAISTSITDPKKLLVYPVNNLLHSLFRQITLTLNSRQIGQNTQNYAYRAYIENLLNYSLESSNQHLDGIVFKMDTAGSFEKFDSTNLGSLERAKLFQDGDEVDLIGRLHIDMLNSSKFLLNGVDIGLSFELNRPEFYLQKTNAKNQSSLKILKATVYIDHIKVTPDVALAQQQILDGGTNARYNYKRCEVRNHLVQIGSSTFSWNNVSTGALPEFCIIAMVDTEAYNGSVTKNPFNFQTFNIQSFNVTVNGLEVGAPRHLEFNFNQNNPLSQHSYFSLFKQLNLHKFDQANLIDRKLYNAGCFLLAYDLTPDRDTDCNNFINSGSIRFEARFAEPLPVSVTVLAYLQYDADLIIDKDRNVYPANF